MIGCLKNNDEGEFVAMPTDELRQVVVPGDVFARLFGGQPTRVVKVQRKWVIYPKPSREWGFWSSLIHSNEWMHEQATYPSRVKEEWRDLPVVTEEEAEL